MITTENHKENDVDTHIDTHNDTRNDIHNAAKTPDAAHAHAPNDKSLASTILVRMLSLNLFRPDLDKLDLTYRQKTVLLRLLAAKQSEAPLAMTDLSNALNTTKSSTSQTVAKLERRGLVRRSWAKDDRRRIELSLTGKGSLVVARLTAVVIDIIEGMLSCLSLEEKKQFASLFDKCASLPAAVTDNGGK